MSFDPNFIPRKPFPDFKWRWACLTCTESINDPIILLGVLGRMRRIEGVASYSSQLFSQELIALEEDINDSIPINLSGRGGKRNIIRNSGQYWKALGLIDDNKRGLITLTQFGRDVADKVISKMEFATVIVKTLTLPNRHIQNEVECKRWKSVGLEIKPLKLILSIIIRLFSYSPDEAYLTVNELIKIVIPLSGNIDKIDDFCEYIIQYRNDKLNIDNWPNCCPRANDKRMAREFLLFLEHYGFLRSVSHESRLNDKYFINTAILDEIMELIGLSENVEENIMLNIIRNVDIISDIERKRVVSYRIERPNQAKFRKDVLFAFGGKCIVTGVSMSEVLEAAHIKPVKYNGNDSISNALCLRLDIHQLFDTGHLRISLSGNIILSDKAKREYLSIIPTVINLPRFTSPDLLRWRWDNYNGI